MKYADWGFMFPETPFRTRQVSYLIGTVSVLKTDIKKCDSTAQTTYSYIVRAVLSQTYPLFLPYLIGAVSVLKTDIKGDRLPHSMREKRGGLQQLFPYI